MKGNTGKSSIIMMDKCKSNKVDSFGKISKYCELYGALKRNITRRRENSRLALPESPARGRWQGA